MKKSAATRLTILQKAFELIYTRGYQATSIDDILATTELTKGAFYYHFKNKDEMGLAIINEILKPALQSSFIEPLQKVDDPLDAIYTMMHYLLMENEFMKVEYGCPASNLTQEMAPWNKDFASALNEVAEQWEKLLVTTIDKGKKSNLIRKEINSKQVALFIVSGYWGIRNMGKLKNSKSAYLPFLKELKSYLKSLQ